MELELESLTLRNFFSFGNSPVTYSFKDAPLTTMIIGENLDDQSNGIGANGVGKTTLLNGWVFLLFERIINKLDKLDNVINSTNGSDMFLVGVAKINGTRYKITRARGATNHELGKNFTIIEKEEGGEWIDVTPAGGSKHVNAYIEEMLVPYELFVRSVVFSAANTPFLELEPKQSREIVETLAGLTELSEREGKLKERIKETNDAIKLETSLHEARKQEYERATKTIEQQKERVAQWEATHANNINQLSAAVSTIKARVDAISTFVEPTKKLKEYEVNLSKATGSLGSIVANINRLNASIASIIEAKQKAVSDRQATLSSIITDKETVVAMAAIVSEYEQAVEANNAAASEWDGIKSRIAELTKKADNHTKLITDEQSKLASLTAGQCFTCKQSFHDADMINAINASINEKTKELDTINSDLNSERVLLQQSSDKLAKCNEALAAAKLKWDTVPSKFSTSDKIAHFNSSVDAQIAFAEKEYATAVQLANDSSDIDDIKMQLIDLEQQQRIQQIEVDALQSEIQSIRDMLGVTVPQDVDKYEEYQNQIIAVQSKLEQELTSVNPHTQTLDDLVNTAIDEPSDDKIVELENTLKHQKMLQKLLIHKDSFIRKALLSKCLPYLNSQLAFYLNALSLPYIVKFTPQLSVSILRGNKEISVGNLSRGQSSRVNFAVALALRDAMQMLHGKINVCILDEVMDTGLDSCGVIAVAKILKDKAKADNVKTFIISHREEVWNMFPNRLKVRMEGGFSYLVDDRHIGEVNNG